MTNIMEKLNRKDSPIGVCVCDTAISDIDLMPSKYFQRIFMRGIIIKFEHILMISKLL